MTLAQLSCPIVIPRSEATRQPGRSEEQRMGIAAHAHGRPSIRGRVGHEGRFASRNDKRGPAATPTQNKNG